VAGGIPLAITRWPGLIQVLAARSRAEPSGGRRGLHRSARLQGQAGAAQEGSVDPACPMACSSSAIPRQGHHGNCGWHRPKVVFIQDSLKSSDQARFQGAVLPHRRGG